MDIDLAGYSVVVTGAAGGIGKETAAVFCNAGASVFLIDKDEGRLAPSATVAILTGRDVASARRIVAIDALTYAGNHGAEWWENGRAELLPEVGPYVAGMHRLAGLAGRG